jgi:hypothetical protein
MVGQAQPHEIASPSPGMSFVTGASMRKEIVTAALGLLVFLVGALGLVLFRSH